MGLLVSPYRIADRVSATGLSETPKRRNVGVAKAGQGSFHSGCKARCWYVQERMNLTMAQLLHSKGSPLLRRDYQDAQIISPVTYLVIL
jgi:hypothetical protein